MNLDSMRVTERTFQAYAAPELHLKSEIGLHIWSSIWYWKPASNQTPWTVNFMTASLLDKKISHDCGKVEHFEHYEPDIINSLSGWDDISKEN